MHAGTALKETLMIYGRRVCGRAHMHPHASTQAERKHNQGREYTRSRRHCACALSRWRLEAFFERVRSVVVSCYASTRSAALAGASRIQSTAPPPPLVQRKHTREARNLVSSAPPSPLLVRGLARSTPRLLLRSCQSTMSTSQDKRFREARRSELADETDPRSVRKGR